MYQISSRTQLKWRGIPRWVLYGTVQPNNRAALGRYSTTTTGNGFVNRCSYPVSEEMSIFTTETGRVMRPPLNPLEVN
jgi:hypothetical protein